MHCMAFWRKSVFFSPQWATKMQVAVWLLLRSKEDRNQWNCVWEGNDNGNLVVNTAWGQQRKSTCETSPKGSVTGKTYEAAFYGARQSSPKKAVHLFNVEGKKKILQSQQVKDFQCPKRNHPSLNWTHIPGIQSHPISQEKILAQCWGPDSFYIWFHSWKWPPLLSLFSWHIQLHIRSDFPIGALRYGLMRAW